jgi:hypothetical protein
VHDGLLVGGSHWRIDVLEREMLEAGSGRSVCNAGMCLRDLWFGTR